MKPKLELMRDEPPAEYEPRGPSPIDLSLPLRRMLYNLESRRDELMEHFDGQVLMVMDGLLRRCLDLERQVQLHFDLDPGRSRFLRESATKQV